MMPRLNNKILVIVVCLAVAIVLIGGFMLAGSPQTARQQQIDMIRSNNLMQISSLVDSYQSQTKTLPSDLSALYQATNDTTGFVDPASLQPYEYTAKGDTSFELCAVFDRESQADANGYLAQPSGLPNFYQHSAGRTCFTVNIPTAPVGPEVLPVK
jgi:type II secretory pathway pseudopilin PulG